MPQTEENGQTTGSKADPNKSTKVLTIEESQSPQQWQCLKNLKFSRYFGLLLAILSSLMFSINALIFKLLAYSPPLTPATIMFLGTALFNLPLYLWERRKTNNKNKISWGQFGVLCARGFSGCSGMLLFFYSLQYLSIGDALLIACSSPVFVFLLAFFFLKENCGVIPMLSIVLTLIGVGIITRPPLITGEESFKQNDLIGAALALGSMLSIATTLVLMRYLQGVHHAKINLVFGVWGTAQTLAFGIVYALTLEDFKIGGFLPKDLTEAGIMVSTGFVFFVGQCFLALALQLEEAGPVALLRTSEVLWAFLWQTLFLSSPDLYSVCGGGLIMMSIFITLLRKWIGSLAPTHPTRNKLKILLK